MSRRAFRALMAFGLVACSVQYDEVEAPIRSGDASPGSEKFIFMTLFTPPERRDVASAVNVKYQRCLLTAAHVIPANLDMTTPFKIWEGATPLDTPKTSKEQWVQAYKVRSTQAADHPWMDLAVVFLKNLKDAADQPRIVEGRDYDPQGRTNDIGLASTQAPDPLATPPAPTGSIPSTIYGYGVNATNAAGDDIDGGTRRQGTMNARVYFQGSAQATPRGGSVYLLTKRASNQVACVGDSGGPFVVDNKVAGISSQDSKTPGGVGCNAIVANWYAGLDKGAVAGGQSNWDWATETMEKLCRKTMNTGIQGPGRVVGTLTPAPALVDGTDMNGSISCTAGDPSADCWEAFHSADGETGRAEQSMTLTASSLDPHYVFDHWTSSAPGSCPCLGSTSPTCIVTYSTLGNYAPTYSFDVASCVAVLVYHWSGSGSGGH